MSGYPQGDALVEACRAGLGKIVIVEGATQEEDPYFYRRWFDADWGRELSFVPQNGWPRVVEAVALLRTALPGRSVFGIRDRDFSDEAVLQAQSTQVPADGVFLTQRYTLENYLLDPDGWYAVLRTLHRGAPPQGWDSREVVEAQVHAAYRDSLAVSAYNWTVHTERARLPKDGRPYLDRFQGDPRAALSRWEADRSPPRPLAEQFDDYLALLTASSVDELSRWVTGKSVLKLLLERLPLARGGRPDASLFVTLYMDKHPTPPEELERLIRRIAALP